MTSAPEAPSAAAWIGAVEWLVLTTPIEVAAADIASFARLSAINARPAQQGNRRHVQSI